jgi:hypothetical protein
MAAPSPNAPIPSVAYPGERPWQGHAASVGECDWRVLRVQLGERRAPPVPSVPRRRAGGRQARLATALALAGKRGGVSMMRGGVGLVGGLTASPTRVCQRRPWIRP